jgi:hypothetical protein
MVSLRTWGIVDNPQIALDERRSPCETASSGSLPKCDPCRPPLSGPPPGGTCRPRPPPGSARPGRGRGYCHPRPAIAAPSPPDARRGVPNSRSGSRQTGSHTGCSGASGASSGSVSPAVREQIAQLQLARVNPKKTSDPRPSASAIMRGYCPQELPAYGERARPAGRGCRPRAAQRRAGEFQILDYKIPRSAQSGRGEGCFMLTDRYGLPLSTTSTAARDDYVLATDRYPSSTVLCTVTFRGCIGGAQR